MFPDFFPRMDAMIEVRDEGCNRSLKINVVFPERVIRIDQQRLIARNQVGDRSCGTQSHVPILSAARPVLGWPRETREPSTVDVA